MRKWEGKDVRNTICENKCLFERDNSQGAQKRIWGKNFMDKVKAIKREKHQKHPFITTRSLTAVFNQHNSIPWEPFNPISTSDHWGVLLGLQNDPLLGNSPLFFFSLVPFLNYRSRKMGEFTDKRKITTQNAIDYEERDMGNYSII